nr:hypothetical protein MTCCP1_00056 [uncultured bacterium]
MTNAKDTTPPERAAVTAPAKPCWETPVLEVLPLSMTKHGIGANDDGAVASTS